MKSIITLVALVIMASPSFAAPTKKAPTKTTTAAKATETRSSPASNSSNTYSNHRSVTNDGLNWTAGLGLGTFSSTFAFGARVHGLVPVSRMAEGDILVGGETGFLYAPSGSAWVIPIMAEGQFNFKGNGKITPYAGLSMGVGIAHSTGSSVTVGAITVTSTASDTSANFALLAKGGLYFGEEQKLFAELPLGVFASAFTIIPTFGMRF